MDGINGRTELSRHCCFREEPSPWLGWAGLGCFSVCLVGRRVPALAAVVHCAYLAGRARSLLYGTVQERDRTVQHLRAQ